MPSIMIADTDVGIHARGCIMYVARGSDPQLAPVPKRFDSLDYNLRRIMPFLRSETGGGSGTARIPSAPSV